MGRVSSHENRDGFHSKFGPGLWYTGEGLCKLYTVAWQLSRVTKLIPESGNLCRATARAAGRTANAPVPMLSGYPAGKSRALWRLGVGGWRPPCGVSAKPYRYALSRGYKVASRVTPGR